MSHIETYEGMEPIAIIGMAGRFPGAKNIHELWQNLYQGVESVTVFRDEELAAAGISPDLLSNPRYVKANPVLADIDLFDAAFFGYSPKEAALTDPQQRLFLECAHETLESAGYNPETYPGRISVYAGCGMNTYLLRVLLSRPEFRQAAVEYQVAISNDKDFLATRVCYKLNLKGAGVQLGTACSTSLVAVHLACQSLLSYQCDMALAGGASIRVPQTSGYLYQESGILSPDGHCRAFDAQAQGTIPGSGVGIVLLKRLTEARADRDYIYAVIRGSAINNDGSLKVGFTAPSVEGQAEVIAEAQAVAGVSPESMTYVETHGTGTTLGDPIEIAALTQAFRAQTSKKGFCAIGSVKTNIGHLDAAAGVTGLIKTALALKNQTIPPSLNFTQPNPKIDFENSPFYVNAALTAWHPPQLPRRAGVSSFGIGGTNAHVVLEEAPGEPRSASQEETWQVLTWSAKTAAARDATAANLADHFEKHPDVNWADAAYTLHVGRKAFTQRGMVVCKNLQDAQRVLRGGDPQRLFTAAANAGDLPVIFLFPGQGAQYVNMGLELYQTEPVFRTEIDRCAELLRPVLHADMRHLLYPVEATPAASEALNQTALTQPALFAVEYALAKLWMAWGLRPQAMLGHSLGEYVAACLSGVFTLEDALALVAVRGQMVQALPGGAMLGVPLAEHAVQALLAEMELGTLALAAVNAPVLSVVSGPTEDIATFQQRLSEKNIEGRPLHTSHAFHSEMMEPILKPYVDRVSQISLHAPEMPYISNVTGKWITAAEATDPDYWVRHLRQTVRFADGLQTLCAQDAQLALLEVGPGRTLSALARAGLNHDQDHIVLTSIRHPQETVADPVFLLTTLGKLWLAGVQVDWAAFHAQQPCNRIPLPTHPFERTRCWIETQPASPPPLQKKADLADWFYLPSWKRSALPVSGVQPSGRWLIFLDECEVGSQIAERLKQHSQEVITVSAGSGFAKLGAHEYAVLPGDFQSYDALLDDLRTSADIPKTIVHLWSVTTADASPAALLDAGLYSLLALAQAIGKYNLTEQLRIAVISNNMQAVVGGESEFPAKAALLGPVKVIPLEYPYIRCQSIDVLLPNANGEDLIARLLDELLADAVAPVVALRGRHRWVPTVEPIRLEQRAAQAVPLREQGVYLITGGLGGIGLTLAEHLAKTVQARLMLIGRSAFPAQADWEAWLNAHDAQDRVSLTIRKLLNMQALGADVLTRQADVSDESQMQAVITQAQQRFGAIHGVIHAAGLADYAGVIQRRTRAMTEEVLAAKVAGTLILDRLLGDAPLDFMLLCSSLGNILYKKNFGQVAYNAANEFLDAFAEYKTHKRGALTISVNWNNWQDVGMSAAALQQWAGKQGGLEASLQNFFNNGLTPFEGMEVFGRILAARLPRVAVSTQNLLTLLQEEDTFLASELTPSENSQVSHPALKRPSQSGGSPAFENEIERTLAEIWQELLGIEEIGRRDNFFDLGGQSLTVVRMITQIREKLGIAIVLAEVYEYPTIQTLARQIQTKTTPQSRDIIQPPLVAIQPQGGNLPLFFMHAAEGNVFCYIELSRQLGIAQPFYGLKAFGIDAGTTPLTCLEDIVARYVKAIRTIQPTGPYRLGGHCLGGAIAYAIAQEFRRQHEDVALLAIIDGYAPPLFRLVTQDDPLMDLLTFSQTFAGPFNLDLLPAYCELRGIDQAEALQGVYRDIQTFPYEDQLQILLKCLQKVGLKLELDLAYLDRAFNVYRGICTMFRNYPTIAPYEGLTAFFRAADERQRPTDDPTLGWGAYIAGLTVHDAPGNHFTVLTHPHVQILAQQLHVYLKPS